MAIDGIVKAGTETKWGISEESTFGAVIEDNVAFVQMEGPVPSINEGVIRNIDYKANGSRIRLDTDDYFTQDGGIRVISFSDLIVRRTMLADLLYGVFGNVTEGATTPYSKDFVWTSSTTQPDYSASAGYFMTVAINRTLSSKDRKYTSCILRTLTLTADLTGDGRLRASGEFISGFSSTATANLSGTWAYSAANYFNCHEFSQKQINNVDIVLYGFDVTFTNNAVRIGGNSSGDAESYALPQYDVTGNLLVKWDTATDDLLADSKQGNLRELDLQVGSAGVAGHFAVFCDNVAFGDVDDEHGDERGHAVNVPFTALFKTGGGMCTATVADGSDRSW